MKLILYRGNEWRDEFQFVERLNGVVSLPNGRATKSYKSNHAQWWLV